MIACVGMSTTLHGYLRGLVTDAQMKEALLFFSCSKGHVLTPGGVPCEATMLNTQRPIIMRGRCRMQAVDHDFRAGVMRFLELVREADADGRVAWGIGSQTAMIGAFPEGTDYFWRRGWETK